MSMTVNKSKMTDVVGTNAAPVTLSTTYQRSTAGLPGGTARTRLVTQRRVQVFVEYNAAAIGGIAAIVPVGTGMDGQDVKVDADVWYILGVWDGTVTAGAGTGLTVASGTDWTITQDFGRTTVYPQIIQTPAALNAGDKVRITFPLEIGGLKQIGFDVAEVGGGAVGTIHIAVLPYA